MHILLMYIFILPRLRGPIRLVNMTSVPKEPDRPNCEAQGERTCSDGRCIPKIDLCRKFKVDHTCTVIPMCECSQTCLL